MSLQGYLTDEQKSIYADALYGVFQTFMRSFQLYVDAKVAVVNTSPTFAGMFGDSSQNSTATPYTPQLYTAISGCLLYANKQPWEYIEPGSRGDYQQNKIRESFGQLRLKVDPTGYALLKDCEQITVDSFTFTLDSNARPHGLVGNPTMYTFTLSKSD